MKNIAVILAGGSGKRTGEAIPKQFIKIAGKKVIEHTIDAFEKHPEIDEICVVVHGNYVREMESIAIANRYGKLKKILSGGKERHDSSLAAIRSYEKEGEANLLFHDSVRPLVDSRIISDCIAALGKYNAVDTAIPTTDTIISVDGDDEIVKIPRRDMLRNGQTPQGFKLSVISKAYGKALEDPYFRTTDDCGVVLKYLPDEPIYVVRGEQANTKLTLKEDIFMLDKLFQLRSNAEIGAILDEDSIAKLNGKVIVVFGGSYGIGKAILDELQDTSARAYSFSRGNGVDISDHTKVAEALEAVYKSEGKIDGIVCTAGVLDKQPLSEMEYDTISRSVGVNYIGILNVAKESFGYLQASKGSLLLYTSSSYTRGRALYAVYSSLKAATVNLVQALAEEWSGFGAKVNCINPERTKTPMRIRNFGNEPEGTLLSAEKVAKVSINVLLSPMTGEVIDVRR